MIDRTHDLPVARQCQVLWLARSTAYYRPQEASAVDLALMRRIDELHLEHPFAGSRMLRDMLGGGGGEGHRIGRKHVATAMKKMGIEALYKQPNTSRRYPAHPVYPYLLRNMEITRANHVFAADITYIPMKRGFVYLFAAKSGIGWYLDFYNSRRPHSALDGSTSDAFCFANLPALQQAA